MASTFPAAIASEPPPLDASSEDEDSEEFRSHGLKLDVPSGEPTPVSTPYKRPQIKSPGKRKSLNDSDSGTGTPSIDNIEEDDTILEVTSGPTKEDNVVVESSPVEKDSFPKENDTNYRYLNHNIDDSGTDEDISCPNALDEVSSEFFEAPSTSIEQNSDTKTTTKDERETEAVEVPTCASKFEDSAANVNNTGSNNCDINERVENKKGKEESQEIIEDGSPTALPSPSSIPSIEGDGFELRENFIDPENCESSVEISGSSNNEIGDVPCAIIEQTSCHEEEQQNPQKTSEDSNPDPEFDNFCAAPIALKEVEEATTLDLNAVHAEATVTTVFADEDFDDDDFGAFQSIPSDNLSSSQKRVEVESRGIVATSTSVTEDNEDDDDFGDFSQVPAQQQQQQQPTSSQNVSSVTNLSAQPSFDDSGDFADFRDCSFQSFQTHTLSQSSSDISRISSKVETLVKSLFVIESPLSEENDSENENLKSIDSEISNAKDNLWARVQDFEGSQGLMFKWLNCLTEKHLLKSLNIDNSNIMYHEKWGTIEVPKFAASLVQSPLQPQSCTNQIDPLMKIDAHHSLVNNNNNNVTDEGISCQDHDKPPAISVEAQEILRQLPDLSYMRANTLVFPQSSPSGI